MKKRIGTCLLLVLSLLLSSCAPETVPLPAAGQPAATPVEKVATFAPTSSLPSTPQPTATNGPVTAGEQDYEKAIANTRALLDMPQLELTLVTVGHSPNAVNHPAYVFNDPLGNEYYVSTASLQPVEFTIVQTLGGRTEGAPKTPDELRQQALQFAAAHSTRFERVKANLKYSEGNKGDENSFFRWEMPGTDVGGMPAILQIGLKRDGSLFSYLNSLDFLP